MEEQKKQKFTKLQKWEAEGIPCYYARFERAVPPHENSEPVYEFQLVKEDNLQPRKKYCVESIVYTEHGVIWRSKEEIDICPLSNIAYARFI